MSSRGGGSRARWPSAVASTRRTCKTRLRSGAGGVVLDGVKYYATGALTAHWIAVSALDEHDRVALAFVPREAAGVTLTDDWNVMGQRATVSGSVRFENVAVDPELVLPYWECFEVPQVLGARAQLYHAAIQVGLATGALRGRPLVRDREGAAVLRGDARGLGGHGGRATRT